MTTHSRAEFTREELATVLSHYDLGTIEHIEPVTRGSRRSPKLIIRTNRGRYLLKRRAPGRDDVLKVAFAHAVQQYLAKVDFPLPRLQPTRDDGDTLLSHDGATYELFEHLPGATFDRSPDAAHDAGRILGLFHKALQDYRSEWEPPRVGYHDNESVRAALNGIPTAISMHDSVAGRETELLMTVTRLSEIYGQAADAVEALDFRIWPRQIVHADWHPGNMLFVDGHVSGVIDYDSLRWQPRSMDVANGSLQFSIVGGGKDPLAWPAAADELRLSRFLAGYESVLTLRPQEIQVLPHLMIEALIAEAVFPIAATGLFGRMEGFRFLRMIRRKSEWIAQNERHLTALLRR